MVSSRKNCVRKNSEPVTKSSVVQMTGCLQKLTKGSVSFVNQKLYCTAVDFEQCVQL
jgi:hypothetical protein